MHGPIDKVPEQEGLLYLTSRSEPDEGVAKVLPEMGMDPATPGSRPRLLSIIAPPQIEMNGKTYNKIL